MKVISVSNFDLKSSITSGQSFRVYEEDNKYITILHDRVISIYQNGNKLYIESNDENDLENVVRDYFDLNINYDELFCEKDDVIRHNRGYKVFNQDKFEMLISYIISQNNNVKRIGKIIDNISEAYGKKVVFNNKEYYLFPRKEDIINLTFGDVQKYKLGFRDKYIISALEKLKNNSNFLESLNNLSSKQCLKVLQSITGIGPKVASCILLFAYHRFDVYPIDTYVKQYMHKKYNISKVKDIEEYMNNKYKDKCGLYIQYVFNYERNTNF